MENLVLPILIAITVSLAAWGLAQLLAAGGGRKRRLHKRLTAETQIETAVMGRSLLLQEEQGGLASIAALQGLQRQLTIAYPGLSLEKFLAMTLASGLAMGLVIGGLSGSPVVVLVAFAFGLSIPLFVLSNKRGRRQRLMADQLPEALDFLSRILRAGHSLSTGLQMMAEELPQPLAGEFERCHQQHSLGAALEDGLRDMAHRIDSSDFSFFVTAVLIQRQTGGDLAEVLDNISGMIRQRIRLQNQVKAKTAEGRFTGYVLVAFPLVMFLITNALSPAYGEMLRSSTGLMMLGSAGALMILGLLVIRRITTVRV